MFVYANSNMSRSILQIDAGIGPIWFLPCSLIVGYVSTVLIYHCKSIFRLTTIALFLSVLGGIVGLFVLLPLSLDNAFALIIFYVIGFLIKRREFPFMKINTFFLMVLFMILQVIVQITGSQSYASRVYQYFPLNIMLSIVIVILVWILMRRFYDKIHKCFDSICKTISDLGKNSLLVLCLHTIEFVYLRDFWLKIDLTKITLLYNWLKGFISCVFYLVIIYMWNFVKKKRRKNI